jgi:hypothetical protein
MDSIFLLPAYEVPQPSWGKKIAFPSRSLGTRIKKPVFA